MSEYMRKDLETCSSCGEERASSEYLTCAVCADEHDALVAKRARDAALEEARLAIHRLPARAGYSEYAAAIVALKSTPAMVTPCMGSADSRMPVATPPEPATAEAFALVRNGFKRIHDPRQEEAALAALSLLERRMREMDAAARRCIEANPANGLVELPAGPVVSVKCEDGSTKPARLAWCFERGELVLERGGVAHPIPEARVRALTGMLAERLRQDVLHPFDATRPDGTGGPEARAADEHAHAEYERAKAEGRVTNAHAFREEANEALASTEPGELSAELGQVGAFCLKWLEIMVARGDGVLR